MTQKHNPHAGNGYNFLNPFSFIEYFFSVIATILINTWRMVSTPENVADNVGGAIAPTHPAGGAAEDDSDNGSEDEDDESSDTDDEFVDYEGSENKCIANYRIGSSALKVHRVETSDVHRVEDLLIVLEGVVALLGEIKAKLSGGVATTENIADASDNGSMHYQFRGETSIGFWVLQVPRVYASEGGAAAEDDGPEDIVTVLEGVVAFLELMTPSPEGGASADTQEGDAGIPEDDEGEKSEELVALLEDASQLLEAVADNAEGGAAEGGAAEDRTQDNTNTPEEIADDYDNGGGAAEPEDDEGEQSAELVALLEDASQLLEAVADNAEGGAAEGGAAEDRTQDNTNTPEEIADDYDNGGGAAEPEDDEGEQSAELVALLEDASQLLEAVADNAEGGAAEGGAAEDRTQDNTNTPEEIADDYDNGGGAAEPEDDEGEQSAELVALLEDASQLLEAVADNAEGGAAAEPEAQYSDADGEPNAEGGSWSLQSSLMLYPGFVRAIITRAPGESDTDRGSTESQVALMSYFLTLALDTENSHPRPSDAENQMPLIDLFRHNLNAAVVVENIAEDDEGGGAEEDEGAEGGTAEDGASVDAIPSGGPVGLHPHDSDIYNPFSN